MAIDSRQKRFSMMSMGRPWIRTHPLPDGSFSQADREQLIFGYTGILSAAPFVSVPLSAQVLPGRNLTATVRVGRNLTGRVV